MADMRHLVNLGWWTYLFAAIVAGAVLFIAPSRGRLIELSYAQSPTLVAVMVSLLGFVIAALAIVVAVQDRGLIKELKKAPGDLWGKLMAVFTSTSKTLGLAALVFFVISAIEHPVGTEWIDFLVAMAFATALASVGLQIAKVIFVLERVGHMANHGK